jgi:predicted regulator of Ras-like GTPase activity (Roadblock/LC7/MglB family)
MAAGFDRRSGGAGPGERGGQGAAPAAVTPAVREHLERRRLLQAILARLAQETVASVVLLADSNGQAVAHWYRLGEVDIAGIAALTAGSIMARQALSIQFGAGRQQGSIVQEYDDQIVVLAPVDEHLSLLVVIEEAARLGLARVALRRAAGQVAALHRARG